MLLGEFFLERIGMRIVASDYDGTLYTQGRLIGDVVSAVWKWREAGNRFGLATGRDSAMTFPEVDKWALPVDFYVCINGAAVYDHDRSLLAKHNLPDGILPVLLNHPACEASVSLQLSGVGPLRVVLRKGEWFSTLGIPFQEVSFEEALKITDIGQISVAYPSEDESMKWTEILGEDLSDVIVPHRNKTTIDINAVGVDKAKGIKALLAKTGWPKDRVYTVGDGSNDIGMIKEFGGFTVPGASEEVRRIAKRMFADVPDMLANI